MVCKIQKSGLQKKIIALALVGFQVGPLSLSNWNLECWFFWKKENGRTCRKSLVGRQEPPTESAHIWYGPESNLGHAGRGERSHHCAIPVLSPCFVVMTLFESDWFHVVPILVPRGRAPFGQHQESRLLARSNTASPRFTDFPSLCACSESSLTNLIGWDYETITLGPFQRSQVSVLVKRNAASRDENCLYTEDIHSRSR